MKRDLFFTISPVLKDAGVKGRDVDIYINAQAAAIHFYNSDDPGPRLMVCANGDKIILVKGEKYD